MFALPAEPGARRERLLEQRRRVDEHFYVRLFRPRRSDQKRRELLELALEDIVIVAVARVDRNGAGLGALERRQRIGVGAVVEAEHDDAFGVAHQRPWIDPPLEGLGHPGHVAVRAFGEPGGEILARMRRRLGRSDAAGVEAERARLCAQGF